MPNGFEKRCRVEREGPLGALVLSRSRRRTSWRRETRRCSRSANSDCVLHFYHTSKNHTRRWYSMSGCGNQMNAQAHYRRQLEIQS